MANPNVAIENYPVVEGGQLKVGDIVSFPAEVGSGHTAIYVGGGRLIQATPDGGVEVTRITEKGGYENMIVRRYKP